MTCYVLKTCASGCLRLSNCVQYAGGIAGRTYICLVAGVDCWCHRVRILIFIMRETADLSSTGVPKAQAQLDAKTRDRDSKPAPGTQPIQAEQCSSPGADHVPNGKVN